MKPKKKRSKRSLALDRLKFALNQPHERRYVLNLAKTFYATLSRCPNRYIEVEHKGEIVDKFAVSSAKRICSALVKILD